MLEEEGGSSDSDRERRIQQNLATINAIVEDTGAQGSMISTEELRGQSDNQRLQHDTIPHHASASGKIPQECAMAHPQHSDSPGDENDDFLRVCEAQAREYNRLNLAHIQRTLSTKSSSILGESSSFDDKADNISSGAKDDDPLSPARERQNREYNRLYQAHIQRLSSSSNSINQARGASDGISTHPVTSTASTSGDSITDSVAIALEAHNAEYDRLYRAHMQQSSQESETIQQQSVRGASSSNNDRNENHYTPAEQDTRTKLVICSYCNSTVNIGLTARQFYCQICERTNFI